MKRDPELSWGGNLFWKITACYPTCWPLRQRKEKLDAMLTALLSLNLLLGQEQFHQLPRNSRIINWKIFIKHLGGTCHKLGIPGRRLSGSLEPKSKLPEEMDSEETVSSEKRHGCEGVGTGHGSLLTGQQVYETCKRRATMWTRPPKCSGNKEQHWELLMNTTSELPLLKNKFILFGIWIGYFLKLFRSGEVGILQECDL